MGKGAEKNVVSIVTADIVIFFLYFLYVRVNINIS